MMRKLFNIATVCLLTFMAACNADTSTGSSVAQAGVSPATKAAEPIPQPGGFSNIDNAKLQALLDKGVKLVDIRLKEEWQQTGIIKDSNTITFFDRTGQISPNFVPEFTKLVKKDEPVALICRTGNRTNAASQAIAQQLGYTNVLNVTHGITGWIAEKRPVVKYQ